MNNDLISREALKENITRGMRYAPIDDNAKIIILTAILSDIDNAPTVTVDEEIERQREELYQSSKKLFDTARMLRVERPQGEWIKWNFKTFGAMGDWEYKCSNCGKVYGGEYNYCPNCGAEMRKGGAE